CPSRIRVVVADLDVLEQSDGVAGQYGHAEVCGDQVVGDALRVHAVEHDGDARRLLELKSGVVQPDDTPLILTDPDQQDVADQPALTGEVDAQLVRGEERNAAP